MTEQREDIDVDQLMTDIEAPSAPRPESAPEAPAAEAQQPTWNGEEWAFETGGKKVIPDSRDKVMTWASQGYNYSQRMGELNKTHAQRMAEAKAIEERYKGYDRYAKVDEFAKANPEWWEHVQKGFETRETPRGLPPEIEPIINPLLQRLQQTESVLGQWQQEKQQQEIQAQDQALDAEIGAIREQYPNIDLNAVDPADGKSLEVKVLEHAGKIKTDSFKAAFRDYFHDKLLDLARSEALEKAAKEKESQAKKGILGRTPAPVRGVQPTNHRSKSYDQLTQEALAELGIS